MLGKDLSVALGGIGDAKIAAAAQVYTRKKKRRTLLLRAAAMAATLVILLTAALWPWKNADAEIVGELIEGSIVTILEVDGSWGKIEQGWINLQFVKYQ